MRGSIPSLLQYAFMAWCSVIAQGQLYLYCTLIVISFSYCPVIAFVGNWEIINNTIFFCPEKLVIAALLLMYLPHWFNDNISVDAYDETLRISSYSCCFPNLSQIMSTYLYTFVSNNFIHVVNASFNLFAS
jgi:hypothetical protein